MSTKNSGRIPPCLLPILTRRRLLKGAAASAALSPIAIACGSLPGEFAQTHGGSFEPLSFTVSESRFEALQNVGGMAYAKVEGSEGSLELVLVRSTEDEVLAFDHLCPHAKLGIAASPEDPMLWGEWLSEEGALRCNRHGSVFGKDGTFDGELSNTNGVANIPVHSVSFDAASGTGTVTF